MDVIKQIADCVSGTGEEVDFVMNFRLKIAAGQGLLCSDPVAGFKQDCRFKSFR